MPPPLPAVVNTTMLSPVIRISSAAALAGMVVHYAAFYLARTPLFTEAIAEWIMARTPSSSAVWILDVFGRWAKPFAVTGGLASLGFGVWLLAMATWRQPSRMRRLTGLGLAALPVALGLGWLFHYASVPGHLSFWLPALAALWWLLPRQEAAQSSQPPAPAPEIVPTVPPPPSRRQLLVTGSRVVLPAVMGTGVVAVAVESYLRNEALARSAVKPVDLFPFRMPVERESFAPGLVRSAVTPVGQFYRMSKNTVDPSPDPQSWKLRITVDGRLLREFSYPELLSLSRIERYVTLRCVSNNLRTNLMGTALWSGIHLNQLVDPKRLPPDLIEAAFIGVDGHDDSVPLDYAFSDEVLLAVGMNGKTLNRDHGFPIRLLVPRYYGFKNVKWIGEIRFTRQPYYGLWPRLGYTKEPVIHTMSFIDRIRRTADGLAVGGVSFSGSKGIQRVELRADSGDWHAAMLEAPLSPYTWTRWKGLLPERDAAMVEARARDGWGNWQAAKEKPLFPDGVAGPTIRQVTG